MSIEKITTLLVTIVLLLSGRTTAQNNLTNPSACGLGLSITDNNCPENLTFFNPNLFNIQVTNAPGSSLGNDVYLREVQLIIVHEWASDLDIKLISPGGVEVELTSDNGGDENDYGSFVTPNCQDYSVLSYNACQSIIEGVAPFTDGPYQPEQGLYLFNDRITNPNGIWQLQICDDVETDLGTLEYVNLVFETTACLPINRPSITNIDTTTIILDWDHPLGVDCETTIVEFGPPGFIPGDGANGASIFTTNNCPPIALTGLNGDTTYDIYVRKQCGNNSFSENSCPITGATGCQPAPVTIVENFNNTSVCAANCGEICVINGNWRNTTNDDFDWIVTNQPSPTFGTGPMVDVNGDGQYVYLETSGSDCTSGKKAYLVSNCIRVDKQGNDACHMSFNYHMLGSNIGSLSLETTVDGGFSWQQMWAIAGDQGNQWNKVYLAFDNLEDNEIVQFRFIGEGGNGPKGDIALDAIVFYGSENLGSPDNQYFADQDDDGFGDPDSYIFSCEGNAPIGYVSQADDCNDTDPLINPSMDEIPCDNLDNNCNGIEDDVFLPAPLVQNDSICSGESGQVCATASFGRPIFWYGSATGNDLISFGECLVPEIPENNSPFPITYTYYAAETDFICASTERTPATIIVFPKPDLSPIEVINICRGESVDFNSLNFMENNFTGAELTFHTDLPASEDNQLSTNIVSPNQTTIYFAVASVGDGCSDNINIQINVTDGPVISFDPSDNFTICKDAATVLAANVEGGNENFDFQWSTGSTDPAIDVEANFISGTVDNYILTVTNNSSCFAIDTITVTTISSIDSVRRVINNVTNCNGNDGSVTLTPLNGLPPFRYIWESTNGNGGEFTSNEPTYTINGLTQGAYRITITDNSTGACDFVLRSVILNGPDAVIDAVTTRDITCEGANDGGLCVEATGNNLVYNWSNGAITECIENLSPGVYSVTITEGICQTVLSNLVINEPEALSIFANPQVPSCAESNDGQIELNVFGGTSSYGFEWDNGASTQNLIELDSGLYQVTVTDANNCQLTNAIELTAPEALTIQLVRVRNVSCAGLEDGILQVNASGGTPPYRYIWSEGQTTPLIAGLNPGSYSVTISDIRGCTVSEDYEILSPSPLSASLVEVREPDCIGDNNGRIAISTTGGTPPYRFDWQNGITDSILNNVGVGNYNVVVVDGNNCFADTISVQLNAQSVIDFDVNISAPTCFGLTDGNISLEATGTPPFSYQWSTGAESASIGNVGVGEYAVTVTDAQGCRKDSVFMVDAPQVFSVEFAVFQPSCFNSRDGVINVNLLSSGEAPLVFRWSTGGNSQSLVGIREGDYNLTITDGLGCFFVSDTLTITNPTPLRLHVDGIGTINCFNDSTGFIETSITGGAAPYDYDWVGIDSNTDDLYNLQAGNYRLLIRDDNDCPIDTTFILTQPNELRASVEIEAGDICIATSANRISSQVNGGVAPYSYTWTNGSTESQLLNIPSGDYGLFVEDENGCTDTIPAVKLKSQITPLTLDTFYVNSSMCSGSNDGSMTVSISGGSTNYRYHFSNNDIQETRSTSATSSNLALNQSYQVTVTDLTTGCTVVSARERAVEPSPLVLIRDSINAVQCFGDAEGAIFAKASGGSPPYSYEWFQRDVLLSDSLPNITQIVAGDYTLVVIDANGCTDTLENNIVVNRFEPIQLIEEVTIENVDCKGANTGSINLSVIGGLEPYRFNWNNGDSTQSLQNLTAGAYQLTVSDAMGCESIFDTIIITEPLDSIMAVGMLMEPSCAEVPNGSIFTTVSGGVMPYDLRWRLNDVFLSSEIENNIDSLLGGTYYLEVQDANGCEYLDSFLLEAPEPLSVEINVVSSPNPDQPGGLSASAEGGTPPYIFFWNTNDTTDTAMDLESGAYSLTVTDANGCSLDTSTVLVDVVDFNFINSINVYPNPTNLDLYINVSLLRPLDLDLKLIDLQGRTILHSLKSNFLKGVLILNVGSLPEGLYFLNLSSEENRIFNQKIMISSSP